MKFYLIVKSFIILIIFTYVYNLSSKNKSKSFLKANYTLKLKESNKTATVNKSNNQGKRTIRQNETLPMLSSNNSNSMNKNSSENDKITYKENITVTLTEKQNSDKKNSTEININNLIINTEKIKDEICDSSKIINNSLNQLEDQINSIDLDLISMTNSKNDKKEKEKTENEIMVKFTICINNVNLIKADLIKINVILETLKKANCKNFEETQKKFDSSSNLVNKLVTNVQNFIRTNNLNLNLVILS